MNFTSDRGGSESRQASDTQPSGPRQDHVATAAYYRAQARGFVPGHELQDWLAAEAELGAAGEERMIEIEGVSGGKDAQPE